MMLTKTEGRPAVPRDGRHCDLCGCSQPAVRCDKCGRQIFCLSCDDMYHRHPKRRFHLRKAVDTTPPTTQARPVLPAKAHATLGGDPSKMPLPPPRKKKPGKAASFFDTFRRRSPSADGGSPPLPKKEYSWTDRFGNIKKFMSNRPLPPLPDSNGAEGEEASHTTPSTKHDLSFIHKKVDEKPPQLPQRSLKPNEFTRGPNDKENQPTNGIREVRNGTLNPSHMNRNNGYGEEHQWNNRTTEHHNPNTLMRQPGYMYPGSSGGYPGNMSASATDLHNMEQGRPPPHQYPHYPPMNPHMPPPHYPHYPMYPQYPGNYPGGYFGSSFANLSSQPATTTDGDHSDHSDATTSRPGKKYQFRKRAKRSQSVLVDRMAFPGQFYPFGPYPPGYGPWGGGGPFPPMDQPPPSPAGSVRSLSRVGRTRRRRKTTSEDEEEEEEAFSVSSSPLSRPKSSSSSGRQKAPPVVTSSSEEEYQEAERSRVPRRGSDAKKSSPQIPRSPGAQQKKKNFPPSHRQRKAEALGSSDAEGGGGGQPQNIAKVDRPPPSSKEINAGSSNQEQASSSTSPAPWIPAGKWECVHCTYINSAGSRICQVCCKTASVEGAGPPPADGSRPGSSGRRPSASSEKSCSSPEKRIEEEEDVDTKRSKQDMAVLNSALDEAEKEISRGLEELMKLKEDFPPNKPTPSPQNKPEPKLPRTPPPPSKPVYKSSGKMRNSGSSSSILGKITAKPTATSACMETQTGQTSASDRVLEARRGSSSSTTSDAYNSPVAQSPVLERTPQGAPKKDTSIQTQTDDLVDFDRRRAEDEAYFGRTSNGYGFRYGDVRMDSMTSPVPSVYDRGGYHQPVMQRSHSRASLFTGRMNDLGPLDYGLGPSPMYRSVSRSSLTGDYAENSFADFHNLRKPAYYLSMEELVERRRQDSIRAQGLELVRMIREAEQQGFTADDIQVALHNCGTHQTPVEWLQENWRQLAEQVIASSANYANEKRENDVGVVSDVEAREALRLHKGNVWPAVTECVESRQRKFLELKARGKFNSKDITDALSANQGDVELAYARLTKSSSKPFLMRIWGAGEGAQNQDGAIPPKATPTAKNPQDFYFKDKEDIQSDGTWDDDEVEWDEDYDEEESEEEEQGDLEDLQTCHEDVVVKTPDSDRSDYCDAFGSNTLERNTSMPSPFNETETKLARRGSFLSKLAGLKRNDKDSRRSSQTGFEFPDSAKVGKDSQEHLDSSFSSDQSKSYNPISVIKNTISAIRDTVGGSKSEKKPPCAAPERRTIVVKGQIPQESSSIPRVGVSGITVTSVKPLKESETLLSKSTEVAHKVSEEILNKNECKELSPLTPSNVSVNQKLTSSPSDARNKNGEGISSEKMVVGPSNKIGVSDNNSSQLAKLQEKTSEKETSISQEYKSNVIIDNKESTYKSEESSSHTNKTGKISLKTNLENRGKNLKSEQNTQELVKDTKENVTKESFSPETSSSPNKELLPSHTLKEEQKGKPKNYLGKEILVNELPLANKGPSDDVSRTSLGTSDKKKSGIESENEVKTEISYSKNQNITNVEICEQITTPTGQSEFQNKPELVSNNVSEQHLETKDTIYVEHGKATNKKPNEVNILSSSPSASNNKIGSSKTHVAAPKLIISDMKAGSSKHEVSNVRTERDGSHLINILPNNLSSTTHPEFSPSIAKKTTALEDYSSIQKTADTSSLENESQVFFSKENNNKVKKISKSPYETSENNDTRDIMSSNKHSIESQCNFSNIPKKNAFESNTNTFGDKNAHETDVLSNATELSLIDNVDASLTDTSSHSKPIENDSPTFESMEPIHSSTFRRSLSNQSAEGKLEAQLTSMETASNKTIENQSSSIEKSVGGTAIITTNETLTSEAASVDLELPAQMAEISAGVLNNSAKQGLKVVDKKTSKELKGVLSTQFTSALKNSAQLNEAHQAKMVPPTTSSSDNADIMEVNSQSLEANSLPFLETGSQIEMVSDTFPDPTSQTKYDVPNQTSIGQNEEPHSNSSILEASTSVSSLPESNIISSHQSAFVQENTPNDSLSLEYGISESSQKTHTLATSIHSASVVVASIPSDSTITTSAPVNAVLDASVSAASVPSAPVSIASVSPASVSAASVSALSVSALSVSALSVSPASVPAASVSADSVSAAPVSAAPVSIASVSPASVSAASVSALSVSPASVPAASVAAASVSAAPVSAAPVSIASVPAVSVSADSVSAASVSATCVSPASVSPASVSAASISPASVFAASFPTAPASISTASLSTASNSTDSNSTASTTIEPASVSSPITYAPEATVPTDSIPTDTVPTSPSLLSGDAAGGQETSAENERSDEEDDGSEPITPPSPVDALRHRFEGLIEDGPIRPASPFRRMSFRSRKEAIALERTRDTSVEKPWFLPKPKAVEAKKPLPKRSLKQQMETERKVRKMVADRKVRTYRKAEVVVQLMDLNFEEEEAIQAANECSTFEMALSYLQQECLLCTGHFPVSHIISMVHCPHKACRDCIRAYFTVQIRDRNIMELLCPFCNEPDISDEDIAQDYFNHLDMMLKKLVDPEIHELFQRKLRDRVLMRDPSFRWCSKCSSGFLAMENLKRLVCPDCNAVTCASCRRPWEREHQGISCEAFAILKDGDDSEAQAVSLAKLLTEDGIDCPRCHFRYALAKGGCMHFRCIQCQHDFCSGCSRPFKMGQKCGVSEFCAKLGLHAHHPRNCLFYLRDKDPQDLQRLLDLSEVKYDCDSPDEDEEEEEGGCARSACQVMEQKETSEGMVDDCCGKEVEKGFAGLCRLHYVEYLGQLVNKHQVDPIQIFENDDLELVLRRASVRLPPKRYRETDDSYREKLVNLIQEELPLDKMDGS